MVDFLFIIIKVVFSLSLSKGVGHLERKFQTEGSVIHQPLLVSENYSDCLSCGIKMFAVYCFVLSHSTRVTDRQMDGRADRRNYDS